METTRVLAVALALGAIVVSTHCAAGGRQEAASSQPASVGEAAPTASRPHAGDGAAVVVKRDNPCSVLLPSEAAEILGARISMREVVDESTCHFIFDEPPPEGPPYFALSVHFTDGRTAVRATRLASGMLGGDGGFERLTGIGDEAWLGPLASMLVFVKGETGVELDLRMIPDGREKGVRLAKLIASRL